jgi:glc operon protein GlcG
VAEAHNIGPMTHGHAIGAEESKKAAAAALAEARANNWKMAVAIVDPAGFLVHFERVDDTQHASVAVAQAKARSAALFKRSTKVFQDMLASGGEGLRVLGLEGAVPVEGGLPIVVDGAIVGAIGLSGGTSAQDGQCAQAGLDALTAKSR